jgi:hypothetical protein
VVSAVVDAAAEYAAGSMRTGCSRFLSALFQFSKRAAGEAAKFGRSGVELFGVVGAARLKCGEPTTEAGELIRRQLGNGFGDFFDFHVAQYSTAGVWLSAEKGLIAPASAIGWQEQGEVRVGRAAGAVVDASNLDPRAAHVLGDNVGRLGGVGP